MLAGLKLRGSANCKAPLLLVSTEPILDIITSEEYNDFITISSTPHSRPSHSTVTYNRLCQLSVLLVTEEAEVVS